MTRVFLNRLLVTLYATFLFGVGVAFAASAGATEWATFEEADRVYHEAILDDVSIEDRVAGLKADTDGSGQERAQRLYLASLLQWRHGDREAALSSVEEALDIERHGVLLHQRGRLLEALSRIAEAIVSYREALPLLSGSSRADTELRMALLIASSQGEIEPLLTLAEGGDTAVQNRVAMALAVLGHAGEAAELYTPAADASAELQRRHALRLTEWALSAGEPRRARESAWRAVDLADSEQDRRYALALLTEAYRQAGALPELVEALESGREVGDSGNALRVSLLREINRPADALAAIEGRAEHEPAEVKRQLLGIYRESGRTAEMVVELKRLIATDPDETIWPQALAEFHLERGDRPAAEAVWQRFVDQRDAPALLRGAVVMQRYFEDLALAAASKAQRDPVARKPAARFRFEFYLERGRLDEARGVLEELETATSADHPLRKTIALFYERLNLPVEALRVMRVFVASVADQDVAATQYLSDLLVEADEAQQAVDLLLATLPAAADSQRRLRQTRLMAAARAAGSEDALVADLTAKLHDGRASEQEAELLLEMRVRAGEEAKALALIDTLYGEAGADPLEKLRQVAAMHRALGNWQAYDDALIQLAERDTDNAVFHIRSRIVNYIENLRLKAENDQEVSDTLMALLEQYLEVSEVGADREFVAGVLALGGQPEAAIAIYRGILAVDPTRLDSYLEIGRQLAVMQRTDLAVGMYQYLLESSADNELSWFALDGILNLQPPHEILEWARRMALARLSSAPERFEYYRQVADLSADLGDNERQLAALHNGLTAAPELRMAILRELLRSFPRDVQAGDEDSGSTLLQERYVSFARRLLALGLALPPSVHLSLGRAMIEAGDSEAALLALNQAVEHTGSDDLRLQAASIFRAVGDDHSAQSLFETALLKDSTNLDLLVDAAWSNERTGNKERAGELFLSGITTLLMDQPLWTERIPVIPNAVQPGSQPVEYLDDGVVDQVLLNEERELFPMEIDARRTHAIEYQRYYIPLRNGLVRVLQGDPKQRRLMLGQLWDSYESTLAFVRDTQAAEPDSNQFPPRPAKQPRLANYPRLRLQSQLLRYLAYSVGHYGALNDMEETLLTLFPEDRQLPEILVSHRAEWGSFAYLDWVEASDALTSNQKEELTRHWLAPALETEEGLLAVRRVFQGSVSNVEEALQSALDRAVRSGDAAATLRVVKQIVETDLIWDTLEKVGPHLSPADKKTVADHAIAILRDDPELAIASLRVGAATYVSNYYLSESLQEWPRSWAARLEAWSDDTVFEEEQLLKLATVVLQRQAVDYREQGVVDAWFAYHALSDANRKRWIKQLLEQNHIMGLFLIAQILRVEQNASSSELLKTAVQENKGAFTPMLLPLYRVDIHPRNVPLARELIALTREKHSEVFEQVSALYPGPMFEPNLLRCEGNMHEALNRLVDILVDYYFDGTSLAGPVKFLELHKNLVSGNEARLIDILERRDVSLPEALKQRNLVMVHLKRSLPDSDPQSLLSVVQDALRADGANHELMQLASEIKAWLGDRFASYEFMERQLAHFDTDRVNDDIAGQRMHGVRSRALLHRALQFDHPIDARTYRDALIHNQRAREFSIPKGNRPGHGLDSVARALSGDDHAVLMGAARRLWQPIVASEQTSLQKSDSVLTGRLSDITGMLLDREQAEQAAAVLLERLGYANRRDIESMLPAPPPDPSGLTVGRAEFLSALVRGQGYVESSGVRSLLSFLGKHPLAVEILESWMSTVRGRMLGQVQALIDALADAHVRKGTAAYRFAELSTAIREQRAGDREIGLWLAIGSRVPEMASSPEAGAVLATYLSLETAHRPSLLLGLARFFAARGDVEGALRCLKSLIPWFSARALAPLDDSVDALPINSVLSVARDVLDVEAYEQLLRYVLDSLKPWEDYLLPGYSEFVLDQFDVADDQQAFYRVFRSDVDTALQTLDGTADEDAVRLMRVATTQLRLDQGLAALDTLKKVMEAEASQAKSHFAGVSPFTLIGESAPLKVQRQSRRDLTYRRVLGVDAQTYYSAQADGMGTRVLLVAGSPDGNLPALLFSEASLDWLRQAEVQIRSWVDVGHLDRAVGIEMLLSLVRAYDERNAETDRDHLLTYLKTQLPYRDEVGSLTAAAIVATLEAFGQPLNDIRLEKELLSKGAIEPEYMAAVVRRIAAIEGEAAALEMGSDLLEFTLNDDLLDELIALADRNARPVQAEEWRALQWQARLARAELERTEAVAQVF